MIIEVLMMARVSSSAVVSGGACNECGLVDGCSSTNNTSAQVALLIHSSEIRDFFDERYFQTRLG